MAGTAIIIDRSEFVHGVSPGVIDIILGQMRNIVTDLEVLRAGIDDLNLHLAAENVTNLDTDYATGSTGLRVDTAADLVAANITVGVAR